MTEDITPNDVLVATLTALETATLLMAYSAELYDYASRRDHGTTDPAISKAHMVILDLFGDELDRRVIAGDELARRAAAALDGMWRLTNGEAGNLMIEFGDSDDPAT
jgi:hypothetical protein